MDRWMARQEDGCRQVIAHNEYEIKKANTMHGWMCPHGDRCRYVLDNNEHKIKNGIHRWMGRHGNGCRYVNDNEYKIKNKIIKIQWKDGWPVKKTAAKRMG